MKLVLVTGGIASGKSAVCSRLRALGCPVYDCDSRCKALYTSVPGLKEEVEKVTGLPFGRLREVFSRPEALNSLENLVYPLLLEDLRGWKESLGEGTLVAFVESAVALSKPSFDGVFDSVVTVIAPVRERLRRNPLVADRAVLQKFDLLRADYIIENNSTLEALEDEVDKYLKTL